MFPNLALNDVMWVLPQGIYCTPGPGC